MTILTMGDFIKLLDETRVNAIIYNLSYDDEMSEKWETLNNNINKLQWYLTELQKLNEVV